MQSIQKNSCLWKMLGLLQHISVGKEGFRGPAWDPGGSHVGKLAQIWLPSCMFSWVWFYWSWHHLDLLLHMGLKSL